MHLAVADQRPVLRKLKLYHGKRGFGVSVECKVKVGRVSILGVTQRGDGRLKFLVAGGESIPGPTFRIGNTNSRIRFSLDPATFVTRWSEEGPTHHCALGVGDQAETLLKVGHLLDVTSVRVCSSRFVPPAALLPRRQGTTLLAWSAQGVDASLSMGEE
jgi:L-arabinose isomerase